MLENETCDEFVSDIVGDIADVACDIIFKKIISDRIAPYAVFAAKELLLEFVEVGFLCFGVLIVCGILKIPYILLYAFFLISYTGPVFLFLPGMNLKDFK